VVKIWGALRIAGRHSSAGHRRQKTLNVLKVPSVRFAQGFFAGCVQQNDFVCLAATLQLDFQVKEGNCHWSSEKRSKQTMRPTGRSYWMRNNMLCPHAREVSTVAKRADKNSQLASR
jgi:hypothetical protein